MAKKLNLDKEIIEKEYLKELKTKNEICNKYNITLSQLNNYLFYNGLTKSNFGVYKSGITKEQLEEVYFNKSLSNLEICEKIGCCEQTLKKLLKKYKIKNRYDYSEFNNVVCEMYLELFSTTQISDSLKIPKSRVRKILIDNNIELRNKRDSQMVRNTNPFPIEYKWEDYSTILFKKCRRYFSNNISAKVKDRDQYKCIECGSKENLHVHHKISFVKIMYSILDEYKEIDYDENKMYEIIINHPLFLNLDNLITVCFNCHYTIYHPEFEYTKIISSQADYSEGSTTIETTFK